MSCTQSIATVVVQPNVRVRRHLNLSDAWILREYTNGDTFEDILLERRVSTPRDRPSSRDDPAEQTPDMTEREVEESEASIPPQVDNGGSDSAAPSGQPETSATPPHMKRTPYGNLVRRPGISPFRLNKGKGVKNKENKDIVSFPSGLPAPLDTPEKDKDFANFNNPECHPGSAKAGGAANHKKRKSKAQINSEDEILVEQAPESKALAKGGKKKAQPKKNKTTKQRNAEEKRQDGIPSEEDSLGDIIVPKKKGK